jgi:xylulokinase
MGVILSAADALEWHAGICGSTANELSAGLGESLVAPCGTVFLPYLSGERTPHNDPGIRGAFVGLSRSTDRAAMTRAVLEGVAFALRDSLEALAAAGARPARLIAAGGGSRSRYWMKLVATVLGLPVDLPADGEHGAAFGAARLGLIAATGAEPESVCPPPPILVSLEPEAALRPAFEDKWHRFRSLYPLLSGVCE